MSSEHCEITTWNQSTVKNRNRLFFYLSIFQCVIEKSPEIEKRMENIRGRISYNKLWLVSCSL